VPAPGEAERGVPVFRRPSSPLWGHDTVVRAPCSGDSPRHPAFAQCSGRRLLSLSLEGWRANSQFREFRVNEENILILQPLTPEFIRTLRGSLKGKPSALKILQKERKCNVRAA